MSLSYEDIETYLSHPFNITFKSGETRLAFVKSYNEDVITFYIYENGFFDNLYIRKEKFDSINIELNNDLTCLTYSVDHNIFDNTILGNQNLYVVKLLGYSETKNHFDQILSRRMYFSSHEKYAELAFYSLDSLWDEDYNFISYKESTNVNDFDLHQDQSFYKYLPSNKSIKVEITPLTGEQMIKNHEIKDCIDAEEESIIRNDDFIKGMNFGGGILIFENEIFISKLFVDYKDYEYCSYKKFMKEIFNIDKDIYYER